MDPQAALDKTSEIGLLTMAVYCACGLIGAGIKVGFDLGNGKPVNKWMIGTTLLAGPAVAGTCTQLAVNTLGVSFAGAAAGVALLLGLMAMGFVSNALEGKIPLLNRFMGTGK